MKVKSEIMIKKTVTNILLLYIVFAVIFGIVLYSIASCLPIVGLESRSAIALGACISMMVMMIALKLTGIKMGVAEKRRKNQ